MPTFLPTIPMSTDALSTSQGDIQNNFTILGAIAGNANPSSASINSLAGFNWLSLPTQGATPPTGSAFPAGNIGLYAATNGFTGQIDLYVNKTTSIGPTTTQTPITASILSTSPMLAALGSGWSYLPSGIIMQWGNFDGMASNPFTVTFPRAFPNQILSVVVTPYTASFPTTAGILVAGVLTMTNFQVGSSLSGVGKAQYIAIGY